MAFKLTYFSQLIRTSLTIGPIPEIVFKVFKSAVNTFDKFPEKATERRSHKIGPICGR
jgi:hypothetical protein